MDTYRLACGDSEITWHRMPQIIARKIGSETEIIRFRIINDLLSRVTIYSDISHGHY